MERGEQSSFTNITNTVNPPSPYIYQYEIPFVIGQSSAAF